MIMPATFEGSLVFVRNANALASLQALAVESSRASLPTTMRGTSGYETPSIAKSVEPELADTSSFDTITSTCAWARTATAAGNEVTKVTLKGCSRRAARIRSTFSGSSSTNNTVGRSLEVARDSRVLSAPGGSAGRGRILRVQLRLESPREANPPDSPVLNWLGTGNELPDGMEFMLEPLHCSRDPRRGFRAHVQRLETVRQNARLSAVARRRQIGSGD